MQKALKIFSNILFAFLLLLALTLTVPRIFGVKTFVVASASMEPAYPVGSVVFSIPQKFENIKEGDTISFVIDQRGTVVSHRVQRVNEDTRDFVVKGDQNTIEDANTIRYDNVLGVIRFSIPYLGFLLSYIATPSGKIIAITIVLASLLLMAISSENTEEEKPKKEKPKKEKPAVAIAKGIAADMDTPPETVTAEIAKEKKPAAEKPPKRVYRKNRVSPFKQALEQYNQQQTRKAQEPKKYVYSKRHRYIPKYPMLPDEKEG